MNLNRDIAARNCLISKDHLNDLIKVKLGDFGLARNMNYAIYLQKNQDQPMPIRWMSPEALRFGQYSSKSDVW